MENFDEQNQDHQTILQAIAKRVLGERGLYSEFSQDVIEEMERINFPAPIDHNPSVQDLRELLWASIDNDDSLDLDQLTVAEPLSEGSVRIRVAVADVDALIKRGSAIDKFASHNTTSIYTAAKVFPMLPEKFSTNLTSLNFHEDRLAIVTDMIYDKNGLLKEAKIYRAVVRNQAKLAYNSVAAWLDGKSSEPEAIASVPGLAENIRLQKKIADTLEKNRDHRGALNLDTIEARPVFKGNQIVDLQIEQTNCAKKIIENFMICANSVCARYLEDLKIPDIRRVVRKPRKWDRIVEFVKEYNFQLPGSPDSRKLNEFLMKQQQADPLRFPDMSLTIIKLLGSGEYVAEKPGLEAPGHFGLAIKDYTHSTAPNRRYPDLITQRLLKAALENQRTPYSFEELKTLAMHMTEQEDIATKAERQVEKSAAALLLKSKIGKQFDALVTGAAKKGTWVRLIDIPVEGKLVRGFSGLKVGNRIQVELIGVNVDQGYIDFTKSKPYKK